MNGRDGKRRDLRNWVLTADCVRWIGYGLGRKWKGVGELLVTADCVRGLNKRCKWKGVGELCVESRLC